MPISAVTAARSRGGARIHLADSLIAKHIATYAVGEASVNSSS